MFDGPIRTPRGPNDVATRICGQALYRKGRESGAEGTRTPDPLAASQVLYQLSYSPEQAAILASARW
jgi:hypothetical protein